MAEAVGLAVSIVQLITLGFSTAERLYEFSHKVSNYEDQIQSLARHVKQSIRILEKLKRSLDHEENSGVTINDDFEEDISSAIESCNDVLRSLTDHLDSASGEPHNNKARRLFKTSWKKTKFALCDEKQIAKFRNELSQCEVTLQLILIIHWRPRCNHHPEVLDILSSKLETLKFSSVPTIAEAVNEFTLTVAKEKTSLESRNSKARAKACTQESDGGQSDSSVSASSRRGSIDGMENIVATSDTSACSTSSSPSSSKRKMWIGRRDVELQKSWMFDEAPVASSAVNAFVLNRASELLEALTGLDAESSTALNNHVKSLQEKLLAIHVRRKEDACSQENEVLSMSFATEKRNEKRRKSPHTTKPQQSAPLTPAEIRLTPQTEHDPSKGRVLTTANRETQANAGPYQSSRSYDTVLLGPSMAPQNTMALTAPKGSAQFAWHPLSFRQGIASAGHEQNHESILDHETVSRGPLQDTSPSFVSEAAPLQCIPKSAHSTIARQSFVTKKPYSPFESYQPEREPYSQLHSDITSPAYMQSQLTHPHVSSFDSSSVLPSKASDSLQATSFTEPPNTLNLNQAERDELRCWDHDCNGREFTTYSNLLRHQRERSGTAPRAYCPRCGAAFTRSTARTNHLLSSKCKSRHSLGIKRSYEIASLGGRTQRMNPEEKKHDSDAQHVEPKVVMKTSPSGMKRNEPGSDGQIEKDWEDVQDVQDVLDVQTSIEEKHNLTRDDMHRERRSNDEKLVGDRIGHGEGASQNASAPRHRLDDTVPGSETINPQRLIPTTTASGGLPHYPTDCASVSMAPSSSATWPSPMDRRGSAPGSNPQYFAPQSWVPDSSPGPPRTGSVTSTENLSMTYTNPMTYGYDSSLQPTYPLMYPPVIPSTNALSSHQRAATTIDTGAGMMSPKTTNQARPPSGANEEVDAGALSTKTEDAQLHDGESVFFKPKLRADFEDESCPNIVVDPSIEDSGDRDVGSSSELEKFADRLIERLVRRWNT